MSYDPHDIRTIRVYDDQYRFITVAKMNDQGGLHDGDPISQEKVSDLNRQKAHYNKAKKHVAEFSITSVLTNEEQLAATVSKAAATAPAPSSMRIIRTPLDGQAKAIAKQEFRKAVGAEATDPSEHAGLNILEQLRQQRQTVRPRSDEFSSDPWSTLRSRENG